MMHLTMLDNIVKCHLKMSHYYGPNDIAFTMLVLFRNFSDNRIWVCELDLLLFTFLVHDAFNHVRQCGKMPP